jgi:hypothetical protein
MLNTRLVCNRGSPSCSPQNFAFYQIAHKSLDSNIEAHTNIVFRQDDSLSLVTGQSPPVLHSLGETDDIVGSMCISGNTSTPVLSQTVTEREPLCVAAACRLLPPRTEIWHGRTRKPFGHEVISTDAPVSPLQMFASPRHFNALGTECASVICRLICNA